MAANKKPMRLSRVAREFNLGIQTIAEFLNDKGIDVEAKPNAKITLEAYDLLLEEFESDKTAKEESKKVGLSHTRQEAVSIVDKEPEMDEPGVEAPAEKTTAPQDSSLTETPAEKDVQPEEKEADREPDDASEQKSPDEKSATEKEKPSKTKVTPEKLEEKVGQEKEKPSSSDEKKETEKQQIEKPEKEDTIAESSPKPQVEEDSKIREKEADKPEEKEKSGLVIQGKIDLDKIDSSTRPVKKSKKKAQKPEKTKEAGKGKEDKPGKAEASEKSSSEKARQEAPSSESSPGEGTAEIKGDDSTLKTPSPDRQEGASKPEKEDDSDFVKTSFEKLDGPKVVGKIDLPEKKKKEVRKKPVATSAEDKLGKSKRKRRRRIKKTGSAGETLSAEGQKAQQKKEAGKPDRTSKRQKRKSKRKQKRAEPTEEEIQKQIKETLEKLSGTGKSKAAKYRREKRKMATESRMMEAEKKEQEKPVLEVTEFVTANELANMMEVDVNQIISVCMNMGMFVSINQRLDAETITILADEFSYEVDFVSVEEQEEVEEIEEDDPELLEPRPPIVTVMGHVDHGKTSLLDHIRESNVIAGEAGGITQHVGAYEVEVNDDRSITFLDTPGHEAFTAMRARGANITDIAIIVIAADDRVMPQTKEAINHAQAAGVPIIFAINKIDKPGADPEKVKEELAAMNLLVEDWGGKYQSQDISALKGENVDLLLEKVLLEAEIQELKANPDKNASGAVLESSLDRGRGYVAKLLVQSGTLKSGDMLLAGSHYGKVKAMYNERNQEVNSAGPSHPVLVLGLHGAPNAGDSFSVMSEEREAKIIATKRKQLQREQGIRSQKHVTLDEIGRRIAIGDFKELNIIVKGDMDGSVEALSDELLRLSNEEVQVNVIHKSVGQIIESDVMLASASDAIIIGFQVRPSVGAKKLAEQEQIDIRTYSIIYEAKKEVTDAIVGLLAPEVKEKVVANLEVRDIFKITKVGTVAGCYVLDGKITRNTDVRLIRDGIVIYTGKLGSLKRFKDDVKEVQKGYECGLNIENFNDIKVGDIIEGFETFEVKRSLEDMKG